MADEPRQAEDEGDTDAGAFIGREPELTRSHMPTTGEGDQDANPDPGWAPAPEGHREQTKASDDDVRRAGST